jgi:hypothetical protein
MGTVLRHTIAQMPKFGMETCDITGQKKVQNSIVSRISDVDNCWDSFGSIFGHYQERGTTVNSVGYSEASGACMDCYSIKNFFFLRAYKACELLDQVL